MPKITKKSGLRYYTSLMKGYFEELFNVKVDSELNLSSNNPVRNSVIKREIESVKNAASNMRDILAAHEQRIAAIESIVDAIAAKDKKEEV